MASQVPVEIDTRLRERHFGALELGPDSAYESVWQQDARDASARRQLQHLQTAEIRLLSLV